MTTIGFIGPGLPIAKNVVGHNRGPARIDALVTAGGRGASTVAEAVEAGAGARPS